MLQLIIDSTDINTLNALYISIAIGITLKFLWAWNVKFTFIGSLSNSASTKIIHPFCFYKKRNKLHQNFILIRIVKYIRKQKYSQDDSEKPISCCYI